MPQQSDTDSDVPSTTTPSTHTPAEGGNTDPGTDCDVSPLSRRRLLTAVGTGLSAAAAGCLGDDSSDSDDDTGDTNRSDDDPTSGEDSTNGEDNTDTDSDDSNDNTSDDGSGGGNDDSSDDTGDDSDSSDDGNDDSSGGGSDDSSNDTGDDDNSDDSDGDSSDDTDDPTQSTLSVTLTDLRAAQVPTTVSLGVDEPAPIAVTVANDGDTAAEIPVTFAVLAGQDNIDDTADGTTGQSVSTDDALASQTLTVTLVPGASERLTASGLTDGLESGSYTVTATAGDQQVTLGLELFADSPVPVTVYTQAAEEGYRADSGQVTVRDDGEPVATASLDSQPVTVELPLARTTRYTVEVSNLDGGAWPDSNESITVGSASDPSIDIVAGYELNGALDLRFSEYILINQNEEWIGFGLYSQSASYHFSYTESLTGTGTTEGPYLAPNDTPPEYGADLSAIRDQLGGSYVGHSLGIGADEANYYYSGAGEEWQAAEFATGRGINAHSFARTGPEYADLRDDLHREYARQGSVRGTPVDVYEIPEEGGTMYVDPETGYTLRYVTHTVGDLPNSYRILDFFDHREVPTVDWELLKSRSVHETAESPEDDALEALPWELYQGEF